MIKLRDSHGAVMPITLIVLMIVAGLGALASTASIMSTHQTHRDSNVKRAVAAAAAGMKAAIYETNMVQPSPGECVTKDANGLLGKVAVAANTWCPQALTENLDDGASYTAYVSSSANVTQNGAVVTERKVVSTGEIGGVKRRVSAYVTSATGAPVFASGAAIRSEETVLYGNSVKVTGGIQSNGNVTLSNTAEVCGNVLAGPGKQVTFENSAHLCPGYSAGTSPTTFSIPQIDPGNTATENDNAELDDPAAWTNKGGSSWDPSTRVLELKNSATLTLTGNVFSLCRLELENSAQLIIAVRDPGTAVRIYIDAPENCPGVSGAGSVKLKNNTAIINANSEPSTLQLYVIGSTTTETSVQFENSWSGQLPMVINAPNSTVTLQNNLEIVGAVQAQKVQLENSTQVTWNDDAGTISSGSVFRVYHRQAWIECTSDPTGSLPDSGC